MTNNEKMNIVYFTAWNKLIKNINLTQSTTTLY